MDSFKYVCVKCGSRWYGSLSDYADSVRSVICPACGQIYDQRTDFLKALLIIPATIGLMFVEAYLFNALFQALHTESFFLILPVMIFGVVEAMTWLAGCHLCNKLVERGSRKSKN